MSTPTLSQTERRQIVSILAELKRSGEESLGRRHQRRAVTQTLWLKRLPRPDLPRPAAFRIQTGDVSLKGIGFFSRRRLMAGELVVLPLQFKEGGGMLVLCEVRHCRSEPRGGYRVGVEFTETLPDPEVNERIPPAWLKRAWATPIPEIAA